MQDPTPDVGALVGLLALGGGGFVLAGGTAYALGPSPRRMLAVAALGIPLVTGLFLRASLESSPTEGCWECGPVLGRRMSGVFVFYLLVNAVTWISGAVVGWALRRTRSGGEQVGSLDYRPLKSGLRFSVNAVRPSRASSEANAR